MRSRRPSLGCCNNTKDIDRAVDALVQIVAGGIAGTYRCDEYGDYRPLDYREPALFGLGGDPVRVRARVRSGLPASG